MAFAQPPRQYRDDGESRRVGFELEFSGLSLAQLERFFLARPRARRIAGTAAQRTVELPGLGQFKLEIDWDFLKRQASEDDADDNLWLEPLRDLAELLVPLEVVCPPIALDRLDDLSPLVNGLRQLGATGTEESLFAAYGVHINTDPPDLDPGTLHDYLRAYCLLQWWLLEGQPVNAARRLSPYIAPYPEAYVLAVLSTTAPDLDHLIRDYLSHNASRNRALDMLPLFAHLDEGRVRTAVDDPKIKPRPAFHYRVPDCHIDRPHWRLADSWHSWWLVETLAADRPRLDKFGARYRSLHRPLLGINHRRWLEELQPWIDAPASA